MEFTKLINYKQQPVTLLAENGIAIISPCGKTIQANFTAGDLECKLQLDITVEIPVFKAAMICKRYLESKLPPYEAGVYNIVDYFTALAIASECPERKDFVVPVSPVYEPDGTKVRGYKSLARVYIGF